MADVTARVKLDSVQNVPNTDQVTVVFGPDYMDEEGQKINAVWARFTPVVQLRMVILDSVMDNFKDGGHYELIIREVDPSEGGDEG